MATGYTKEYTEIAEENSEQGWEEVKLKRNKKTNGVKNLKQISPDNTRYQARSNSRGNSKSLSPIFRTHDSNNIDKTAKAEIILEAGKQVGYTGKTSSKTFISEDLLNQIFDLSHKSTEEKQQIVDKINLPGSIVASYIKLFNTIPEAALALCSPRYLDKSDKSQGDIITICDNIDNFLKQPQHANKVLNINKVTSIKNLLEMSDIRLFVYQSMDIVVKQHILFYLLEKLKISSKYDLYTNLNKLFNIIMDNLRHVDNVQLHKLLQEECQSILNMFESRIIVLAQSKSLVVNSSETKEFMVMLKLWKIDHKNKLFFSEVLCNIKLHSIDPDIVQIFKQGVLKQSMLSCSFNSLLHSIKHIVNSSIHMLKISTSSILTYYHSREELCEHISTIASLVYDNVQKIVTIKVGENISIDNIDQVCATISSLGFSCRHDNMRSNLSYLTKQGLMVLQARLQERLSNLDIYSPNILINTRDDIGLTHAYLTKFLCKQHACHKRVIMMLDTKSYKMPDLDLSFTYGVKCTQNIVIVLRSRQFMTLYYLLYWQNIRKYDCINDLITNFLNWNIISHRGLMHAEIESFITSAQNYVTQNHDCRNKEQYKPNNVSIYRVQGFNPLFIQSAAKSAACIKLLSISKLNTPIDKVRSKCYICCLKDNNGEFEYIFQELRSLVRTCTNKSIKIEESGKPLLNFFEKQVYTSAHKFETDIDEYIRSTQTS